MLTRVEARTAQGDVLSATLNEPSGGIHLAEVNGLDPVNASLVSTKLANVAGARYRTGRRETRNILLTFEMESDYQDYTVQSVRRRLYQFFMPQASVSLRFYDDSGVSYDIAGRVESCEAGIFTQEPTTNVSIICFDPDFIETTSELLTGLTAQSYLDVVHEYEGSVRTGLEITLNLNRILSQFTIFNRPMDGSLRQLDFASPLLPGDKLYINTKQGEKAVRLTRSGVVTSLLYAISPKADWITFEPGDNRFRFYAEGEGIPYSIAYTNRYGGL